MNQRQIDVVNFDNVGLRYGTDPEVLSDLTFTLFPGSFYFLTGASGAGKTSLLKLLYLAQRTDCTHMEMARDIDTAYAQAHAAASKAGVETLWSPGILSSFPLPLHSSASLQRSLRCEKINGGWLGG